MVDIREIYRSEKERLAKAGYDNQNEINVLFTSAFGRRYAELIADEGEPTKEQMKAFSENVNRRLSGEPLQYIAGKWVFLDFELFVGEGVLIPRDETEIAASEAIRLAKELENPSVIDLCAGTGCIAFAVKRAVPSASVTAVELYDKALEYLERNKTALSLDVKTEKADIFSYESVLSDSSVDIVVSNPPYVTSGEYEENKKELEFEPMGALTDGGDGLSFYRHIIPGYKRALKKGGWLIFETGCNQTKAVENLFCLHGYRNTAVLNDMYGKPRVVMAQK